MRSGGDQDHRATVVAEVHTHPPMDAPFVPPSAHDLYQLALAAAKGQHNRSYVVAPEGVYWCEMMPGYAQRLLQDVRGVLRQARMSDRALTAALAVCDEPVPRVVDQNRSGYPHLAEFFRFPEDRFRELAAKRATPAAALAEQFGQSLRDRLGIRLRFRPLADP